MKTDWSCYEKKPKKIKSAKDLLKFFELIPASKWCVDVLDDDRGKRCAVGHLNAAYDGSPYGHIAGITMYELVEVNNGHGLRRAKTGARIKNRVLKFVKDNINR